ncbi:MAG: penicillin-binding protein activator [Proteobacteria bacterium]|nr:penicillin-binding protein activator [Pseudomonadota bacterium]
MSVSSRFGSQIRSFAIVGAVAIALAACQTKPVETAPPPATPAEAAPPNALTANSPAFLTMPNIPADHIPVRVGILLPFSSGTPAVRALAQAMVKAATMALYESGNRDMILITADEGSTPADAADAGQKLLNQGAEIIVGPLYATSVKAIAGAARDRGVAVLSFSTDRSVAGDGVFLISFLPTNDTDRVVSYALAHGHHKIAALIPDNLYGDVTLGALKGAVTNGKGELGQVQRFPATVDGVLNPATAIAHTDADAVFIPQAGAILHAAAPTLSSGGLDPSKVKLLGTGQWEDPSLSSEPTLNGAWFAAPDPKDEVAFNAKFRAAYGTDPPQLAGLAYDAISLIAKLAEKGEPYKRFTRAAIVDPNGFSGADGIFRFMADGTAERGLAILSVGPDGFRVVDPAPTTFVKPGS